MLYQLTSASYVEIMSQNCRISLKAKSQLVEHFCANLKVLLEVWRSLVPIRFLNDPVQEMCSILKITVILTYEDMNVQTYFLVNTVCKNEYIGHIQKRTFGRLDQMKKQEKSKTQRKIK
ncbi:hypothetical protein NPIL_227491 [Nephila pilipes]|uniref:Uncharacterized protein n=1 Tax=Nephila pilipes TaxID=299642 RepID=A0A8X6MLL9_NEPPI|nr:hypothetical protein NPIL_227491 [Nephila pilipes]